MRNSNSRDKPSIATYSQGGPNRLMKTQLPPKTSNKQSLNPTQYKLLPPNTPSIKRIQSSKSTNASGKQLPKQDINFDIEKNMTESKIISAKESLQLLKKRMNRTGMSRQKVSVSSQNSQNIPLQTKTQYGPDSIKKNSTATSNKNLENYEEQEQNRNKYQQQQQQTYEAQSYKAPPKIVPVPQQKEQKSERSLQKKPVLPPPKNQSFYNQAEETPIGRKQTFEEMLERELKNEQAANKKIGNNNSNTIDNRNKPGQKNVQPPSEYPQQTGELFECGKGCGRQFNANVIAKHEKICEKVFQQKRKVFNTAAQRQLQTQGFNKPPALGNQINQTKKPEQKKGKVPKWKLQSAQLRAGLKAVNNVPLTAEQQALNNMQKDSYVPCNYCGRRFSEQAAKRHIPVCQNKAKQINRPMNTTMNKKR